jgi:hypothetical protein
MSIETWHLTCQLTPDTRRVNWRKQVPIVNPAFMQKVAQEEMIEGKPPNLPFRSKIFQITQMSLNFNYFSLQTRRLGTCNCTSKKATNPNIIERDSKDSNLLTRWNKQNRRTRRDEESFAIKALPRSEWSEQRDIVCEHVLRVSKWNSLLMFILLHLKVQLRASVGKVC